MALIFCVFTGRSPFAFILNCMVVLALHRTAMLASDFILSFAFFHHFCDVFVESFLFRLCFLFVVCLFVVCLPGPLKCALFCFPLPWHFTPCLHLNFLLGNF